MIFHFRKYYIPLFVIPIFILILIFLLNQMDNTKLVMGGRIHTSIYHTLYKNASSSVTNDDYSERFQRPSKQKALSNPYTFQKFTKTTPNEENVQANFQTSEDVILAYFGILKDASNMEGYLGGCGSIGESKAPYPYAYRLFTENFNKKVSFSQFENSFRGIGHMTLLKLCPAYSPPTTPQTVQYYTFETEIITGPSEKDKITYQRGGSYFAYYYGLVTTEYTEKSGWKIQSILYIPEDFLCAPWHGWTEYADLMVTYVYKDWYHLIDKIDKKEVSTGCVTIYASGKGEHYRFDFIRLTNGYDKLIRENILKDGKWAEINILKPDDQRLKLSILNPDLKE